jgi:3-deoxy-manno-octulosonate cytidylyltransferase (CMP-KDO synthetase)
MASTRLPGKPLADIAGRPMIAHVMARAAAAAVGPVFVATDSTEIAAAVSAAEARFAGCGRIVLRPSGTESVIRVMAEGEDEALVREVVETLAAVVRQAAAA